MFLSFCPFFQQYFHQPQQYGYVQQPLDRPSVRQQHHQYVMQAGDSNNLPYHQVPEHEHQQRQEQVQVRQLPRPRQNSRHQQSLHFQRRSPEHQGQLGEEEDDIDNNDDVNFKVGGDNNADFFCCCCAKTAIR